jgi:hypothetical protein
MSAKIFCPVVQSSNKVKEKLRALTSFSIFILQPKTQEATSELSKLSRDHLLLGYEFGDANIRLVLEH